MAESVPWTGTWTAVTDSLAANDDLALAIAARRNCEPEAVREELALIDDHFDVDAVYLDEE